MRGRERPLSLFLQAQTEISDLLMFSVSSHTVTAALLNESDRDGNGPPQLKALMTDMSLRATGLTLWAAENTQTVSTH